MPTATIEHVKGSELPAGLLEKVGGYPDEMFTITIESEDEDDSDYPSEEKFRPEFVEEVERRSKAYWSGQSKGTICRTKEEVDAFFDSVWGKDD
ncbi:MAG: hypothetical protein HQK57_10260 [Deltaproteobacteria bacterium]|nr:hypothetical protein [Deltaproteobacteria bacterium]